MRLCNRFSPLIRRVRPSPFITVLSSFTAHARRSRPMSCSLLSVPETLRSYCVTWRLSASVRESLHAGDALPWWRDASSTMTSCCWYRWHDSEVLLLLLLLFTHDIASRRCLRHFARRFLNQTYNQLLVLVLQWSSKIKQLNRLNTFICPCVKIRYDGEI